MALVETERFCARCSAKSTLGCNVCMNITYCSTDCEQTDKPIHDLLCTSFRGLEPRPGPDFRRAIYFPVDSENPRFIWIPVEVEYGDPDVLDYEPEILLDEDGLPFDEDDDEDLNEDGDPLEFGIPEFDADTSKGFD